MTQKEIKLIYTVRKVLYDELMYKYLLSICVDHLSMNIQMRRNASAPHDQVLSAFDYIADTYGQVSACASESQQAELSRVGPAVASSSWQHLEGELRDRSLFVMEDKSLC